MSNELQDYLESVIGKKLFKDEKRQLINLIQVKDNRGRIQKSHNQINEYLKENNIPFHIQAKRTNQLRYWEVVHCISFTDYIMEFYTTKQVEKLLHKMSL